MSVDSIALHHAEESHPPLPEGPEENPLVAYLCHREDGEQQLVEELSRMAACYGRYRTLSSVPIRVAFHWVEAAQYLNHQPPRPKETPLPQLLRAMGRGDPPYTRLRGLSPWVRSLWLAAAWMIETSDKYEE